jgi:CheY-like chemotaxis protein
VILLDLMMPVMDGFQFRDEQVRDPELADIPVIVLTALSAASARRVHPEAILTKPIDCDHLLSVVRAHC